MMPRDVVALSILDEDFLTLQLFLLLPHLLEGLDEAILVFLDLLQFFLAFCNLVSLSLLGLGICNELRKPALAGGYIRIKISPSFISSPPGASP
jgi:hypothetical protein